MWDLVGRAFLGFIVAYTMFWVVWLWQHMDALVFKLTSKDKKFKHTPPAGHIELSSIQSREQREMILIRHGESMWNVVFNRSFFPLFFLGRLIKYAIQEIALMLNGGRDSIFYDSPLSDVGFAQAKALHDHMLTDLSNAESDKHAHFHKILRNEGAEKSLLISSNLRRALTTAALVFKERLVEKKSGEEKEKIMLVSHMQEISPNPDALSIMPAFDRPSLSWIESKTSEGQFLQKVYSTQVDGQFNFGNKAVTDTGRDRLHRFVKWLFSQPHSTVIGAGHSLWIRSFFDEFLPANSSHQAKKKKLTNGAAIGLVIEKLTLKDNTVLYRIQHESVTLVYGGFK